MLRQSVMWRRADPDFPREALGVPSGGLPVASHHPSAVRHISR